MNKVKINVGNENLENSITIQLSELLYLLFFGIMLFAKGIGLYDGQNIYKVFLILAFLCIALKMCITEYSFKEWAAILFLLALSVIVYRVSGEKGVLICMTMIVAMKNVSLKRSFGVGLTVWGIAMSGRFLFSLFFIENVETAVQTKNIFGAVLRYFMGFPHPNVLHISYLILAALIIYCVKETYCWKHLLFLLIGNWFLFFYSYSFTGALIVMMYVCLSYYVKKRTIYKFEYFLVMLVFPGCVLFSVIFPIILRGKAFELADKIFNNRINFAKHFLTLENMSLLGNNLASITTEIITMDNSYIFTLVTYGILIFVLMCVGYIATISSYVKQKKNIELAMICCFLVAGLTEPFLFNTSFKNLTLLFIGEQFFTELNKNRAEEKKSALLRKSDRNIVIDSGRFKKVMKRWQELWCEHRGIILKAEAAAAFIISILTGIFYQPRENVLKVQRDNLLVYERVRVVGTAFVLGFVIVGIALIAICAFVEIRKNEQGD